MIGPGVQVIEALVADRLTSPAPLVRVEDWARCWAVEEAFGIEPALLNDDRLARALDAIAPHLEHIAGTAGARAIGEFGIDVARMHWDMTSMSVHGAFPVEGQNEDFPVIGYGHPRDRRFALAAFYVRPLYRNLDLSLRDYTVRSFVAGDAPFSG